jgi:hypothetical protein
MAPTVGPVAPSTEAETTNRYIAPTAHTILPIEMNDNPHGWNYFGEDMIEIQRKLHLKRMERQLQKMEELYKDNPDYLTMLQHQREQLEEYT